MSYLYLVHRASKVKCKSDRENNFSSQRQRPDRDNFVTYDEQHLKDHCKHEFNKMTVDPYNHHRQSKGLECWGYFLPKTVTSIRNKLISTKKGTFVKASENSISSEFTRTLIFWAFAKIFKNLKGSLSTYRN